MLPVQESSVGKRKRLGGIHVAPASVRAGEAASCRPCNNKRKANRAGVLNGCRPSWKFILSLPKDFVTSGTALKLVEDISEAGIDMGSLALHRDISAHPRSNRLSEVSRCQWLGKESEL